MTPEQILKEHTIKVIDWIRESGYCYNGSSLTGKWHPTIFIERPITSEELYDKCAEQLNFNHNE